MSIPAALSFEYSSSNGECVGNNQVDSLELKASQRDQMEEADAYHKDIIEKSNSKFKEFRIDLRVKEVFTAQFTTCWNIWLSEMLHQLPEVKCLVFIDTMIPTHPEHYALLENKEGPVETIGERPARAFIHPCANTPKFVKVYGDPSYKNLPAMGTLKNDNTSVYIFQAL